MNLKTICRQKGIKKSDLTKEDCFRLGQASILCWLGELLHLSVFNPSKKEVERLFGKKEL